MNTAAHDGRVVKSVPRLIVHQFSYDLRIRA
jgi:hypothetical protein